MATGTLLVDQAVPKRRSPTTAVWAPAVIATPSRPGSWCASRAKLAAAVSEKPLRRDSPVAGTVEAAALGSISSEPAGNDDAPLTRSRRAASRSRTSRRNLATRASARDCLVSAPSDEGGLLGEATVAPPQPEPVARTRPTISAWPDVTFMPSSAYRWSVNLSFASLESRTSHQRRGLRDEIHSAATPPHARRHDGGGLWRHDPPCGLWRDFGRSRASAEREARSGPCRGTASSQSGGSHQGSRTSGEEARKGTSCVEKAEERAHEDVDESEPEPLSSDCCFRNHLRRRSVGGQRRNDMPILVERRRRLPRIGRSVEHRCVQPGHQVDLHHELLLRLAHSVSGRKQRRRLHPVRRGRRTTGLDPDNRREPVRDVD